MLAKLATTKACRFYHTNELAASSHLISVSGFASMSLVILARRTAASSLAWQDSYRRGLCSGPMAIVSHENTSTSSFYTLLCLLYLSSTSNRLSLFLKQLKPTELVFASFDVVISTSKPPARAVGRKLVRTSMGGRLALLATAAAAAAAPR